MFQGILIRLRPATLLIVVVAVALGSLPIAVAAQANGQAAPSSRPAAAGDTSNPYYSVQTITLGDGTQLDRMTINGPPKPPPGHELERAPVAASALNQAGVASTLTVPAYSWVFGCSAVSAAMIGAYFDRNGLPNIYTGPTNGGVMPMDNSGWPTWTDSVNASYPGNPLVASRNGSDGRTIRGSIDDYWVAYESTALDPYIPGGWAQHAWGDAFGDYMKTSQSAYNNTDGSTHFYTWTSSATPLTCADMVSNGIQNQDGTYGRKLFYEARGYSVTDCYNQKTDNNGGGFTFANYKAQIDAGRPVLLNLAGHSIVGVGYADPSTVYIHDTWDFLTHQMTWGGSYSDMALQSVSIVNLATADNPVPTITGLVPPSATPGGPAFTLSVNGTNFVNGSVVRWNGSGRTTTYVNATRLTAAITAADIATAGTASVTVFSPAPGGGPSNTRPFTVGALKKVYLPLIVKSPPLPGTPTLNPISNPSGSGSYNVTWTTSSDASTYILQESFNDSGFASPTEVYNGASTTWSASGKAAGTYYYRVKARSAAGDSGWSAPQSTTVNPSVGWTTIVSTDFEGTWPGSWDVFDNTGAADGEYYWGQRNCRAYAGSYSGWGVGAGAQGSGLGCGANYPNSASSWMVYGPFSLASTTAADLKFKLWLNSEQNYDGVCRMASIDGTNFTGSCTSGNTAGWIDKVLDLANAGSLGNLLGQPNVWIALIFSSGVSDTFAEGGYVDDIVLRKCPSGGTCPTGVLQTIPSDNQVSESPVHMVRPR